MMGRISFVLDRVPLATDEGSSLFLPLWVNEKLVSIVYWLTEYSKATRI